jgi:hypothetical protein
MGISRWSIFCWKASRGAAAAILMRTSKDLSFINITDSNGFCVYDFHPPIEAATSILEASSYDNG